jgi:drug/metabolite transporter (DMT)-like permease
VNDLQWILPALASPIVYAAVTLGDKRIISTLGLALGSFYLYVGFTQLSIAAVILLVLGWPGAPFSALADSFGGGFFWGTGLMLMFFVLRREEVSRVTPVWQSSPVFVALFAVIFLHESLAWHGWLAVLLVVSGAIAVSIDLKRGGLAAFSVRPTFFMLLAGAAIIGVAQLLLKVASEDLGVWHNMAFRGIGLCTSIALPWLRPPYPAGLIVWLRNPKNAVSILLTESVGPFTGNLLLLSAIAVGPISLVSALLGTRPIWVLAGTLLLGFTARHFISERITGTDLVLKTVATSAVVAGIVIISVG